MDKDKAQTSHHGVLHHEKRHDDSALPHISNVTEQGAVDQEAEMDELEARLFAMAKLRS
jgi:hypothetical protein